MSIELFWDEVVPHVAVYRFQKNWTWGEFRETALKEHSWGEALNGERYDIIADLRAASLPHGTPFTNVSRMFNQGPSNRQTIILTGSSLASAMIPIASRLYPQTLNRFLSAKTIEEARQRILDLRGQSTNK